LAAHEACRQVGQDRDRYIGPALGRSDQVRKELAEQEAAAAISNFVSPTAPYTPEEVLPQLTPFTVQLEGRDKRDYERHLAKIRAEDEEIQYGKLKDRIKKQHEKVRAAKRKTKGIKSFNPFIAQAMLEKKQ
jgi:hypothetical protein